MKSTKRRTILVLLLISAATLAWAQETPPGLSAGLRDFQAGQFNDALESFRSAQSQAENGEFRPYADFWVARSLMALGQFDEASDAFDVFLVSHSDHPYGEEAAYQRARLYYLAEEFEAAVQRFSMFQEMYPESDFSANALYWTGEALFELGLLDEAKTLFTEVTERYPTSYRVEAARYRSDVIELAQRENELLTLLQWSHEEYLSALDEFRQKELAYQEALQSYRERLSSLAADDFREEIEVLNARVTSLEQDLADRDERINSLLAELRQAQAETSAAIAIAAAATQSTAPGTGSPTVTSESGNRETTPQGTFSTVVAPAPAAASGSVQTELLSIKAAALELQQLLLNQGTGE